jgi:hypothetical protein
LSWRDEIGFNVTMSPRRRCSGPILAIVFLASCGGDDGLGDGGGGVDASMVDVDGGGDGAPASDGDPGDAGPLPGVDSDGDGLDDDWEDGAGDAALLDWSDSDSDDDGTDDGDEDYDGDGLSNLEEFAAARMTSAPAGATPHPFRVDVLVEVDAMSGRTLPSAVLADASAAYADLPIDGVSGWSGVGLIFYRDEAGIGAADFADNAALRSFLVAHGPGYADGDEPALPVAKLVHLVSASRRLTTPTTPATTVFDPAGGAIEEAGVFIFIDAIDATHPACAGDISVADAQTAAVIHEIGHLLQLGHDTDVGGGVNSWNIMALAIDCTAASMRFFGTGNSDESLGATQEVGASRFSWAAAALMDFTNKLSVDTGVMVDGDGVEM